MYREVAALSECKCMELYYHLGPELGSSKKGVAVLQSDHNTD